MQLVCAIEFDRLSRTLFSTLYLYKFMYAQFSRLTLLLMRSISVELRRNLSRKTTQF